MPGRTLLLVAILVLAGTVPIFLSESGSGGKKAASEDETENGVVASVDESVQTVEVAKQDATDDAERPQAPFWKNWFGTTEPKEQGGAPAKSAVSTATAKERSLATRNGNGPPGITLGGVLRFDATPNWVRQSWARVTTELTDTNLHGMRVPFCSGYEPHDFTGSLTYYFNRQNQVERITLYGFMGDPEPLAALLEQRFGFKRYASVGPGLYMYYKGDTPLGVMRVEDALETAGATAQKYRVRMEMNLPHDEAALSESMLSELRRLREANLL